MNMSVVVQSELAVQESPETGLLADDAGQFVCSHCDSQADENSGRELTSGDRVCDACEHLYFECAECDESTPVEESNEREVGEDICRRCAQRHYTYSDLQQCLIANDDCVTLCDTQEVVSCSWAERNAYSNSDGDWYEEEGNLPASSLHDYGDNVLDYCEYDRAGLASGALVFGVELEMEASGEATQDDLVDALGGRTCENYILKEDGSLVSGVELVTIPLTLDQHVGSFGWNGVLSSVRRMAKSGAGTTNCGMHVHINKAALSKLQIGKMQVFLNSPHLRDQITTIAQRASNQFCERTAKKITDGAKTSNNRHDVVNVNRRTVEIRMFRGNLNPKRVLKNIEFCHALVTYCRDVSLLHIEEWCRFSSWLLRRRSQYPHLVTFLGDNGALAFSGASRSHPVQVQEVVSCA